MPFLTVYTNVEIKNSEELAEKSAQIVVNALYKPINYVVTNIVYNKAMSFAGKSNQKGALVEVLSIGFNNKELLISALTDLLERELQIENSRNINISLIDAKASNVASGGKTFG